MEKVHQKLLKKLSANVKKGNFVKPQEHIKKALEDITDEVKKILGAGGKSLTEKDTLMFPLLQQKRVLQQAIEDLDFLDSRVPENSTTCKMSQYR